MKDPSDNIRDWVYNVLNGTVSYGGSYISVYSFPPKDQAMPYIVIGEQMMLGEGESTKDAWITEHSVTVEIWDSYTGNDGSYVRVNSIGDSIIQLLRKRSINLVGSGGQTIAGITGFNTIRILCDNMITDRYITETNVIIYKSINIRLLLEEV